MEASSSCTVSLISDVTLLTRLSLLPSTTSFYLSNITSFVRQFIPLSANTDTGHLVLFQDCGSILLAVGRLDYVVITSFMSQLVNHLRTRTPMGDLADGRSSSRSLAFYLYKPCFFCLPSAFCGAIKTCT